MKLYNSYCSFVCCFYSFYFDIGNKIATILLIFQEFRDKKIIEHPKLLRAKVLDIRFLTWHFVYLFEHVFGSSWIIGNGDLKLETGVRVDYRKEDQMKI